MKNGYRFFGCVVCVWFALAAAFGWAAPNLGIVDSFKSGSSSGFWGRGSSGGSWGGGK